MCQSKALGGKRCFAHHPGTKASIAYVHLKTGIDKEQIYAIMKELRKEGKNLEAPTPEELEKYFSLEEFKAKYDQTLSDQEKVAILKQLLSARAEADRNGVSGGVFHSWKNALKRTVDKYKKPLVASLVALPLLFTTACSAGVTPNNPTPGPSETKAPTASECVIENPATFGADAVPVKAVTDDAGTYCTITVSPTLKDKYLKLDDKAVTDGVREHFTQEDIDAAQEAALKFTVEQTIDSVALDGKEGSFKTWVEDNNFVNPALKEAYVKNYDENVRNN